MSTTFRQRVQEVDRSNMLDLILHFADQVEHAAEIGRQAALPQPRTAIQHVLVAGMGGSAIGGNILQRLLAASGTVPASVVRDYRLPAWASRNTLVVISSFSGNTEETVSAYESALSAGCPCVVCSSDGKVLEMARKNGHPFIQIPGGRPPRTALGYLLLPLLVNFVKWGWVKNSFVDVEELVTLLQQIAAENHPLEKDDSPAARIVQLVMNRVPIVYASAELEAVAMRWKGQFCENSKVLAFHNIFPEMNHNEIVGWQRAAAMGLNDKLAVLFLKDRNDHPRVLKRMEIVRELIHQSKTPVLDVESRGETLLARMFSLIYLADFVSFNLAIHYGEDPTEIKNIDYLKSVLAKFSG